MNTGLYIHIPFCRSKCIYCDFYSTPALERMENVVDGLISELRYRRDEISADFHTVYIGGGTPSVLPPQLLERLVDAINIKAVEEFTIEVNPDDVTPSAAAHWHNLGINRVSIGIQSLRDPILKMIGRRHTAAQAFAAINTIFDSGIHEISADLIYGLPGLEEKEWAQDLETLLNAPITHLSAYCLTYHEGTMLHKMLCQGRVSPVSDELIELQFNALRKITADHGFEHYEISNFAKPGHRSLHNSSYWNPDSRWLGIGPSAHSFDGSSRRIDDSRISSWLNRLPYPCDIDEEDDIDRLNDNIVTALRTVDGLDLGTVPAPYRRQLLDEARRFIAHGNMTVRDNHISIPSSRWLTSDAYIRNLIILH